MSLYIYLTIAILLVLATLTSVPMFFSAILGIPIVFVSFIYAVILFGIFLLIKYLLQKYNVENFFFEVSGPHPCSGLYTGKPATFQFTQVGSGDCKSIAYPPLGMDEGVHTCGPDVYGNASPNYPNFGTSTWGNNDVENDKKKENK